MKAVKDLEQHVRDLCERHDIVVSWSKRRAYAFTEGQEITIPPVRSTISYAGAMHEVGHILGRHQWSRRVMVRERWAWEWARANALTWTPAMERKAKEALAWYARRAAKIDRFWRPPVTKDEHGNLVPGPAMTEAELAALLRAFR